MYPNHVQHIWAAGLALAVASVAAGQSMTTRALIGWGLDRTGAIVPRCADSGAATAGAECEYEDQRFDPFRIFSGAALAMVDEQTASVEVEWFADHAYRAPHLLRGHAEWADTLTITGEKGRGTAEFVYSFIFELADEDE